MDDVGPVDEGDRRAVEYPPQVRRYAAKVDRQGFVDAIVATAERVEADSAAGAVPADPGDDMVVAAALAGRATFVVTLVGSSGRVKLGQPVPESNLSSDENSGSPETTST